MILNKTGKFMPYIFFFICMMFIIISCKSDESEKINPQKTCNKTFEIIQYNGHSYVHMTNHWNNGGNSLLHDPDCLCHKRLNNGNL